MLRIGERTETAQKCKELEIERGGLLPIVIKLSLRGAILGWLGFFSFFLSFLNVASPNLLVSHLRHLCSSACLAYRSIPLSLSC